MCWCFGACAAPHDCSLLPQIPYDQAELLQRGLQVVQDALSHAQLPQLPLERAVQHRRQQGVQLRLGGVLEGGELVHLGLQVV